MSDDNLYAELFHRLHELTAENEIVAWLDEVDSMAAFGSLTASNRAALFAEAASLLQAFALTVPIFVQRIAVERLATLCVEPAVGLEDRDARYFVSRLRENLAELLDSLPEEDRAKSIDHALDLCAGALDVAPEPACWTVQRLGQRRVDIVQRLRKIVAATDDEAGDIALYTLVSLGLEPNDRNWAVSEASYRARRRFDFSLFGTLGLLNEPTAMDAVTEGWLNLERGKAFFSPAAHALNIYANVADADQQNERLQDQAWQLTLEAVERFGELRDNVLLGSGIAPQINSRRVVPDLVLWLSDESFREDRLGRKSYLIGLRLGECVRPRHLESWGEVDFGALTTTLKAAACSDTGDPGSTVSEPMREKEATWDLLLLAGARELLGWSEDAVGEEMNPFVRFHLLERLACFRLPQLPNFAARWITEVHNHEANGEAGHWAYVSGAISLAHSQMSREAFDALLQCGFSLQGYAAETTASALRGVSQALARNGDSSVAEALWSRVDRRFPLHQRSAAAEAIVGLAAEGLLTPDAPARLLEVAGDEEREVYERSQFVEALTHLGRATAPQHALVKIEDWASRGDWLGVRSLECLASWEVLFENETLIQSRLGLRRKNSIWRLEPDANVSEWAPHVTGILFLQKPEFFAQALADWLALERWGVSDQVLNILSRFPHRYPGERLPSPLTEALVAAVHHQHSPVRASPFLLDSLADIAPDTLVRPDWAERWSEWLPEGRARFADALGRLAQDEMREGQVVPLLLQLGTDPAYGVRRSAFRTLGLVRRGAVLAFHAEALAKLENPSFRVRAAESIGWIPTDRDDLFEMLGNTRDGLASDVDHRVRTTLKRALKSRMERHTTALALERVRSVRGADGAIDVLSAWPFGEALAQLGDDDTHRSLRDYLAATELPRHVRTWIRRLLKAMDDSWRKRVKEQPESWIPWNGAIRIGNGRAQLPNGRALELTYAIWAKPAGSPGEKHAWGGSLRLLGPWSYDLGEAPSFEIEIEGGARGTVFATRVQGSDVVIVGTGPFPGQ
jgi:hypothetical protein